MKPQGWACPNCGKGNAPWRAQCDCTPAFAPVWVVPTPYPWGVPGTTPWWPGPYCTTTVTNTTNSIGETT